MENLNEEIGVPLTHVEMITDRTLPFKKIIDKGDSIRIFHDLLDNSPVEQFITLYVRDIRLVGVERTALGQARMCSVAMSEIFRGAILAGADGIIVSHNHTNDNAYPSDPDINMTDIVMRSSVLIGIPLLDHIIVCPNGTHYSMMEHAKELETRVLDLYYKNMLSPLAWDMKKYHILPGVDPNKSYKPKSFKDLDAPFW